LKTENKRSKSLRKKSDTKPGIAKKVEPRSKLLKYDTAVPGDRGDCEKTSTTQGSE
jgi:hypothetical protein